MDKQIVIIAHDVRSAHNVGALLRTAEGLGVTTVYLTGYTPYPQHVNDARLPHLAAKIDAQIHKTALWGRESYYLVLQREYYRDFKRAKASRLCARRA